MKKLFHIMACIVLCFALGSVFFDAKAEESIHLLVPQPNGDDTISLNNDCGKGVSVCIIEEYVRGIFLFGAGFVCLVAVIWIIIGGYEIMFSGASIAEANSGKQKITQALLGLVLVFSAALLLHIINPDFFRM